MNERRLYHDEDEVDYTVAPRVRRFFHTIKGFHEGYLDLSGRHRRRYNSVRDRFLAFHADFRQLLDNLMVETKVVRGRNGEPMYDVNGQKVKRMVFHVLNEEMWARFKERWRVQKDSLELLYTEFAYLMIFMKTHPRPKFQRIVLMSLPPEILHMVMKYADSQDAWSLGCTSRYLRDISLGYIYKRRVISLSGRKEVRRLYAKGEPFKDLGSRVRELMYSSRDLFLDEVDYYESNRHILSQIEDLTIDSEFGCALLELAGLSHPQAHFFFFSPILDPITSILAGVPNLRRLTFGSGIGLNVEMIYSLSRLQHILTIDYRGEYLDIPLEEGIYDKMPPIPSVANLQLSLWDESDLSPWTILTALPNLKWLSVYNTVDSDTALPIFMSINFNPFRTLERFCLCDIVANDVEELIEWLREARYFTGELHLTHFKLGLYDGIDRWTIIHLLRALQGSPLQYLALDGLNYAPVDLLTTINEMFPNLVSLSLCHRQSNRQRRARLTRWPNTIGEYAQCLQQFAKLEHFGWNMDASCKTDSFLQYYIGDLEDTDPEGYLRQQSYDSVFGDSSKGKHNREGGNDIDERFVDGPSTVKTLAAYCSTLKSVHFVGVPMVWYDIHRTETGGCKVKRNITCDLLGYIYDPNATTTFWPKFDPEEEGHWQRPYKDMQSLIANRRHA
ncbi:hypothetical protein C8Q75DRAFT_128479 [Abortiporus biennis]|nr:hypothetical protein C8Q75DRAFT_128479 [Abortiporus biennis]